MEESLTQIKNNSRWKEPFKRVFANLRKSKSRDMPVSTVAFVNEHIPQTPETQVAIKRFSEEAKQALKEEGYIILELTGQSIKSMTDNGHKFVENWETWNFYTLCSRKSEVAFNPKRLFLPQSHNKTFVQQKEIVSSFSKKLEKKIKDVKVIVGEVPEYAEIIFAYINEELFKDYSDNCIRTNTRAGTHDVVTLRNYGVYTGLSLSSWMDNVPDIHGLIAPLIVPV